MEICNYLYNTRTNHTYIYIYILKKVDIINIDNSYIYIIYLCSQTYYDDTGLSQKRGPIAVKSTGLAY